MSRHFSACSFLIVAVFSAALVGPAESSPLGYFEEYELETLEPGFDFSPPGALPVLTAVDPMMVLEEVERRLNEEADFQSTLLNAGFLERELPNSQRVQWMLVLALAADGQTENAITKLKNAEKLFPTDVLASPALLAKAMVARRLGDLDAAQSLTLMALLATPKNPYAHNLAGMVATMRGDLDGAAKSFGIAVSLSPNAQTYQINLGITELNRGNAAAADTALSAALGLTPTDCRALTVLAQLRDRQLNLGAATESIEKCLVADPKSEGRAAYLVGLLTRQNLLDRAIDVAKQNRNSIENGKNLLAELYLKSDRPLDANHVLKSMEDMGVLTILQRSIAASLEGKPVEALKIAREIDPGDANLRAKLTTLALSVAASETIDSTDFEDLKADPFLAPIAAYFMLLSALSAEDDEAITTHMASSKNFLPGIRYDGLTKREWASLKGSAAIPSLALGTLYHLRDLPFPAKRELLKAQELSRGSALPAYLSAIVAHGIGDRNTSIKNLESALKNQPGFYAANLLMGEVMIGNHDLELAVLYYDKATQVVAEPGVLIKLGVLSDALNDVELAEKSFRKAIELQPNWFVTYNQLAWVFIQREMRLDEAKVLAESANKLQPGNAAVLDNLGWIEFLKGDVEAAVIALRLANDISLGRNFDILLHLALAEDARGETGLARSHASEILKLADASHPQAIQAQYLLDEIATR